MVFFISDEINLWLNAKAKQSAYLKNFNTIETKSKLAFDTNLSLCLNKPNQCLGIIIRNDGGNQTATLKCSNCEVKKQFVCSRSLREFTPRVPKAKLPCIPSKTRSKRSDNENNIEYGKMI